MPNGGSDCCGTCWFNAKNKGEKGYGHAKDPEPAFCTIRALPIEKQVEKVASVKRSHSAVIEKPFCLPLGTTVGEAISFASKHNIGGILIETHEVDKTLSLVKEDGRWKVCGRPYSLSEI